MGCLLLIALLLPGAPAGADQAVGSTTGIIDGTITDATGAGVPRVSVVASGDGLMGTRLVLSGPDGRYRLPALPPGDYTLTFSRTGLKTVRHVGIYVGVGLSVSLDVQLDVAGGTETITVERQLPVLDRQSTTFVTTFDASQLANIPSARSMWALLAATPAVHLGGADVGGNEAVTGVPFNAYAMRGASLPAVEGIFVAGISATGLTLDYGSFEEVSISTAAHVPEWSLPGPQLRFAVKSGGNRYRGSFYADGENRHWQSSNVDDEQILRGAPGGAQVSSREANRLWSYNDLNADIGGYIRKDSIWWYSSVRDQEVAARTVDFPVKPQHTRTTNYSAKTTWQTAPAHKFIAYGQVGWNHQPNRLEVFAPTGGALNATTAIHPMEESTTDQRTRGWIWKGEWNAALADRMFVEARVGEFRTIRSLEPNGRSPRFEDVGDLIVQGGNRTWQERLRSSQLHGSLSYFKDAHTGTHHMKVGGHAVRRTGTEVWAEAYPGSMLHVLRNEAPIEVYLFETPSTSKSGLWIYGAFASDSWRPNDRLTLNLGLRFDRFRVFLPAQTHPAGPFNPVEQQFAAVDNVADWNRLAPRLGASVDLTGQGRTIFKVSYGQYWASPGLETGFNASPNSNPRWAQYGWSDPNGTGLWEPGEEGERLGRRGGVAIESLDPNLQLPFTREIAGWLERQLAREISVRTGIVWRGERRHFARQNINQPFGAFTIPISLIDPGEDGAFGTSDDGPIVQAHAPAPEFVGLPQVHVVRNIPNSDSRYTTWDVSASKRFDGRWSLAGGFAYTWSRDHASSYLGQPVRANPFPLTPNDLINTGADGRHAFTIWSAKVHGTYEAPWDVRITPLLRHQSGQPFGRTFSANVPGYGNVRVLAEPIGRRRMDHITITDLRVEKSIRLPEGRRVSAFIDVFNLFNTNPEQNVSWSSGPSFLRPLDIVAPRIFRLGARVDW